VKEIRNEYNILLRKPVTKRPLRRTTAKCVLEKCGLNCIHVVVNVVAVLQ
jgi:hypothetical protein